MGLLDRFLVQTDEVKFISQTLADYREVRKVYNYEYAPEDLKALQACAKDLRPFTWSCVPAGFTWYLSGKVVAMKGRALPFRVMVGVVRVMATGQVFRMGYLAGSYRQTTGCMKSLVALPTPLGGEIVALIKARSPEHPYLKFEQRPPGMEYSEEPRPRIATDENRLARIAKFRRELAAAKGGQPIRRDEGEALEGLLQQQQGTLAGEVNAREQHEERRQHRHSVYGGVSPQSQTTSAAAASHGGGEVGVSSGPQGLIITDPTPPAWDAQQRHGMPESSGSMQSMGGSSKQAVSGSTQRAAGHAEGPGSVDGDVFGMLGAGFGDEEEGIEDQLKQEQQARRERRRDRWGRPRRRSMEGDPHARQLPPQDGSLMEGSD